MLILICIIVYICGYVYAFIGMLIVARNSFKNGIYIFFTCNTQVYVLCIIDGET
jgi:hypothetical protein